MHRNFGLTPFGSNGEPFFTMPHLHSSSFFIGVHRAIKKQNADYVDNQRFALI
jgi:hypothetical protein